MFENYMDIIYFQDYPKKSSDIVNDFTDNTDFKMLPCYIWNYSVFLNFHKMPEFYCEISLTFKYLKLTVISSWN